MTKQVKTFILLLICLMTITASASANQNRVRFQTIENPALGFNIDLPRQWTLAGENEEDGVTSQMYLGAYGEELAGLIISSGMHMGMVPDLHMMAAQAREEFQSDDETIIHCIDVVDIAGTEMLRIRVSGLDNGQVVMEFDTYFLFGRERFYRMDYLSSPGIYDKLSKVFEQSIASLQLL